MNRFIFACIAVMVFSTSAFAGNINGIWYASDDGFTVTLDAGGSYRAECTNPKICSLCAGGGPVIETGTYQIGDESVTITVTSSNAPNKDQRINVPMTVPFEFSGQNIIFGNAQKLTFDCVSTDSIEMIQKTSGIEHKTWRAVKELFR